MPNDFVNYRPPMFLYNPKKVPKVGHHHAETDTCFSPDGSPLIPSGAPNETALGRWLLSVGDPSKADGFQVDIQADQSGRGPDNPEHGELRGATIFRGMGRCLVTNRSLRFTGYAHRIGISLEWKESVLAFTVPLAEVSSVDPGKSNAFAHLNWLTIELDGLGTTISVAKAEKANEKFGTGVLATNKRKEFAAQIEEARRLARNAIVGALPRAPERVRNTSTPRPRSATASSLRAFPSADAHAEGNAWPGNRCPNPECEAEGLATPLLSCDLCGADTAPPPEPAVQLSPPLAPARLEPGEARMCRNERCDAKGLATPLSVCDLCGTPTI